MKSKLYNRSIVGGIVSPSMVGRIDDSRRDSGLEVCSNMLVMPEGIGVSRPGTRYVNDAKNADRKSRVIPFRYSSTQALAMEFGHAYIRFHSFAATLLTPTSGVAAWNNGDTYSQGDLVTYGGTTWYAASDVPANKQPDLFEYGAGTPVVSASWVETSPASSSPPSGYTNVGSDLPAAVTIGAQVYIQQTSYVLVQTGAEIQGGEGGDPFYVPIYDYVAVIVYVGYTGTAVSSTEDYWYALGEEYEIPSPYAEMDLFDLHYVQSGDVLTITHPSYAPRELRRLGATQWVLTPVAFGSTLAAPTISAATPTTASSPSDLQNYSYVATNVTDDQLDESVQSSAATASNQLFDTGALNTITFGDAARRNVYRLTGGIYGFVGQTITTSLVDDNIAPDISKTPPLNQNPFATDWPAAVTYYQQRRGFGGTPLLPQSFWLTKSGTESNLDYAIPPRDNDAIAVKIAAREASTIRHMVPIGDLVILTSSGAFTIDSGGDVLTPSSASPITSGYVGASNVQPVVVDDDLIFVASRGGHLRGMGYSFDRQRYVSADLSVRAAHLFDYKNVMDMAFTRAPTPIVWSVSSDGRLIGMTYVPAEDVKAFHTHETAGFFESCCSVSEGDEDILYAVVRRTIGGSTVRYIECFSPRFYTDQEDAFFVDCGLTYNGAAATTISGLDHIEGETVNILADGYVVAQQEVSGGAITLETAANVVQVGLPLTRTLRTLPVAVEESDAYGQGQTKSIGKVWARLIESGAISVGTDLTRLYVQPARTDELYGSPANLRTGVFELNISDEWNQNGQFYIVGSDPLPLTVASLAVEVEFGG